VSIPERGVIQIVLIMEIDHEIRAPFNWSDQQKLDYAMTMAEKLLEIHPQLAMIWLNSADLIRNRINKEISE
jgi:hypothetical protein